MKLSCCFRKPFLFLEATKKMKKKIGIVIAKMYLAHQGLPFPQLLKSFPAAEKLKGAGTGSWKEREASSISDSSLRSGAAYRQPAAFRSLGGIREPTGCNSRMGMQAAARGVARRGACTRLRYSCIGYFPERDYKQTNTSSWRDKERARDRGKKRAGGGWHGERERKRERVPPRV